LKNQGKLEFHKVGKSNIYTIPRRLKKWRNFYSFQFSYILSVYH
jgi:hypothetical protein